MDYFKIQHQKWLFKDLSAGFVVFLVALPLCLGVALASGAPLYSGLISGIIGGIIVSMISGSALSVSGPAAGLSPLVLLAISSLGGFDVFLMTLLVAGFFQIIIGIFKLGTFAHYFPTSVIKGMLASIGIILISKQIPIAIGYDQPDFWHSGFLQLFENKLFFSNWSGFKEHISFSVCLLTLISLGILLWSRKNKNKKKLWIPAPLLVVFVGMIYQYIILEIAPEFALKPKHLVQIPSDIFSELKWPQWHYLWENILLWKFGIMLALLASLETLLCVEAVDKLDPHNRITPLNRELLAQGIGNMTCGVLGGIPITAVVVRGSANVHAGAKTKRSAFFHGVYLLLAVILIPFLINQIAYASLAAILLFVGFDLAPWALFKNMWHVGRKQFLPFAMTIFFILVTDLLIGVCIGLFVSLYFIILNNFSAQYKVNIQLIDGQKQFYIKLNTNVTFLNKVQLKYALDKIPNKSKLFIDGSESHYIDYDVLELISEFAIKAKDRQIHMQTKNIQRVNLTSLHES